MIQIFVLQYLSYGVIGHNAKITSYYWTRHNMQISYIAYTFYWLNYGVLFRSDWTLTANNTQKATGTKIYFYIFRCLERRVGTTLKTFDINKHNLEYKNHAVWQERFLFLNVKLTSFYTATICVLTNLLLIPPIDKDNNIFEGCRICGVYDNNDICGVCVYIALGAVV